MKTNTKNWILLIALAAGTLASTVHAQTSVHTSSHSSSHVTTVSSANGITRIIQGGGDEPQAKDDLFAGVEQFNKNATDVTEINMGPDSLGMVGGSRYGSARNMVLNIVRTYSYDKPGLYDMGAVEAFRNKLNTGEWRCTVHTRNMKTGESTDVCSKARTDGMREEAIITIEPKELTFIHTIRKVNSTEGGHSEVLYGPLPGVSGYARMALNDPDNFVDMLLARHGVMVNQMQGLVDLKLDTFRIMRDHELATVRPFTIHQLDTLKHNFSIQIDPQPNVHVHVTPDPSPAPEPAAAPEAPPAPTAPEAPAAPAAPRLPE